MRIRTAGNALVVLSLVVVTGVNLWNRYLGPDRLRSPASVSTLAIGTDLSGVEFQVPHWDASGAKGAVGSASCHLLVVYSSTCTHCHAALSRARDLAPEDRLPTTWIPLVADSLVPSFAAEIPAGSGLRIVDNAKAIFRLSAVPAAFVVGPDDRVKAVFGYTGREDRALLESQCGT